MKPQIAWIGAIFAMQFMTVFTSQTICQMLDDVCVPTQDILHDCRCALTKTATMEDDRAFLLKKFFIGSSEQLTEENRKDNEEDGIRFEFLPQTAVRTLDNFFAAREIHHELNRNIFKDVKYEVHVELMTIEKSKALHLFHLLNGNHLSASTKSHLVHCSMDRCEQPGVFEGEQHNVWNKRAKKYFSEKAIRFDFDNTTMVAFATAKSECVLEHVLQEYREKICKTEWVFWKTCWWETKFSERVRQFTPALRTEWNQFISQQMINHFRSHYYNLIS